MPGPFVPVWALSRSQNIRIGNRATGAGSHVAPMLTKNPSSAAIPTPLLVDLSDGPSRRDLAHHLAIGAVLPAHGLRLQNSAPANVVASTTAETLVNQLWLPANALGVGSTLRVTQQGVITATTCTNTVKIRIGPLGTLADPSVLSVVSASGTAVGYVYDALVTTQAVGSGTNGKIVPNAQIGTHSASPVLSSNTAQVSLDTTIGNWVTVSIQASVSAGVTATNCLIEFVDQNF